MKFIKTLGKGLFFLSKFVLAITFFFVFFYLLSLLQEKLFLPKDYRLWTSNYPLSRLIFIFELYIIFLLFKSKFKIILNFAKRNKKWFYPAFALVNFLLLYAVLFNVSVITENRITNHSFLAPQGKTYSYSDISSIDTGIYGKKLYFPFTHSAGDFYYKLILKDGTTIYLFDSTGGTQDNRDVYEVIGELDGSFVSMGIGKTASLDNFELLEGSLDIEYSNKIKKVITNTK
ncbi:MAG TPA: hypothetical protein VFD33_04800 [Bacillota bacterium]|nr:hypothetical protein [Bacillota bacterium]